MNHVRFAGAALLLVAGFALGTFGDALSIARLSFGVYVFGHALLEVNRRNA